MSMMSSHVGEQIFGRPRAAGVTSGIAAMSSCAFCARAGTLPTSYSHE
jgi:hypothetical protein